MKLPFYSTFNQYPVDRERNVLPIAGDQNVMPHIVVQKTTNGQTRHNTGPEIDIEQHSVVAQLQGYVVTLRAPRIHQYTVCIVCLKSEAYKVPIGFDRLSE